MTSPDAPLVVGTMDTGAHLACRGPTHRDGDRRLNDRRRLIAPLPARPSSRWRHRIAVIGCGFDGSPESRAALSRAVARQRRARLQAVAVATVVVVTVCSS